MKYERNGEVLAHVAGPSGAGKTELINRLAREIENVELKDLDEYDDAAVEQLGWTRINKNDYTEEMLDRLHAVRQRLIDEDIRRIEKPIIFFGHTVEGDNVTKLPTRTRILLDVDPAKSAVRVGRRPGKSLKDVRDAYKIAIEDREWLLNHGYKAEKPSAVYNELKELSRKIENNPGLIDALGRIGGFASGINATIDAHDKLVKKRVIKPIIGGRRKVKKSKRNSSVSHIDLPDDIVNRLGRETVDAVFASEDPAGTVRALMTQAAADSDYWALDDYTRLLAMLLAGGGLSWDETERKHKENPFREIKPETRARLARELKEESRNNSLSLARRLREKANDFRSQRRDEEAAFYDELADEREEANLKEYGTKNPAYTVHVSSPSVNESVEVHALTQGGALRKGRARLRGKAKVHPRWSVERNPTDEELVTRLFWGDYPALMEVIKSKLSYEMNGVTYPPNSIDKADIRRALESITPEEWEELDAIGIAPTIAENPSRKRRRKNLPMAVLLNPMLYVVRHQSGTDNYATLTLTEAVAEIEAAGFPGEIAQAALEHDDNIPLDNGYTYYLLNGQYDARINPSAVVSKLRRMFTDADNALEEARGKTDQKQIRKAWKKRELLLTNLRAAEQKERIGQRNGVPEIASSVKSKLNKISRMFHGPKNPHHGKFSREYISDHVKARNFSRAGSIPGIKLEVDAKGHHASPDHICEECTILTNPKTSKLGISTGKRVQVMGNGVLAAGKRLKRNLDRMTDEELETEGITRERGGGYNLGKANTQWYTTIEKWSDIEDPDLVNYFHEWAEETREYEDKPDAKLDENGMLWLHGGKHTVTEAGIEN